MQSRHWFSLLAFVLLAFVLLVGGVTAQVPYGTGTPGTGGITPVLTCNQAWMGHGQFAFQMKQARGGATGYFGLSRLPAQWAVGSTQILVDLSLPSLMLLLPVQFNGQAGAPGAGSAIVPLPLVFPTNLALAGTEFYAQCVVVDYLRPGSPAATRGLKVELTLQPAAFFGTSVGGSVDPYWIVDPLSLTTLERGGSTFSDNVTDAEFTHGGKGMFVGSSIRSQVNFADVTSFPAKWKTIYTSAGSGCYGLGYDKARGRLYTLTDVGNGQRDLVALDVQDPNSANFGKVLGSSVKFAGGAYVERWALSPSGNLAAVLSGVLGPTNVIVVDTDPTSAAYLSVLQTLPVPLGAGLALCNRIRFSADESQILVLIQIAGAAPGEIARYDRNLAQWIDHNATVAGVQNIGPSSTPAAALGSAPTSLDIAPDGSFAVVSGFGGSGWAGRLDLVPGQPMQFAYQSLNPGVPLPGAWGCGLSRDGLLLAIGTFGTSDNAVFVDPLTGKLIGQVGISGASNLYTVKFR